MPGVYAHNVGVNNNILSLAMLYFYTATAVRYNIYIAFITPINYSINISWRALLLLYRKICARRVHRSYICRPSFFPLLVW